MLTSYLGILELLIIATLTVLTTYTLIKEKEADKVTRVLAPGLGIMVVLLFLLLLKPSLYRDAILLGIEGFSLLGVLLLFFLPIGKIERTQIPENLPPIDERDIMFARATYQKGDGRYEDYYQRHPEFEELDDVFRKLPGLCSPKISTFNPISTAVAEGNFHFLSDLSPFVEGDKTKDAVNLSPLEAAEKVKGLAKYFGADLVGITKLKPYHLYSHRGRKPENYGDPVETQHQYAIVFAVEMDFEMVRNAPQSPTLVESSQEYVKTAILGMQLSYFIRHLGYDARNHMDGNYLVVAPLIAVDAGLGEIGRMGILMTEKFGPRVRLGVVTTDLPLALDKPVQYGMESFCLTCEKCARECPSLSIPHGPKTDINGVKRWQINQQSCYSFWCRVGTDCGICMNSCPYSKPNTLIHKLARVSLRHSQIARQIFPKLDDYLYGKRMRKISFPSWLEFQIDKFR